MRDPLDSWKNNTLITLGPHILKSPVLLAPMAGISDYPMRTLCQEYGAGLTPSEMVTAKTGLWSTDKSSHRLINTPNADTPHSIQIVGSDPQQMATAAQFAEQAGADIIDINMGCPAKKVCKKLAGSALLGDEKKVVGILSAVVEATELPVTLKIRTGTNKQQLNAPRIGQLAEQCGIQMLAIHGRTRACRFNGHAEFDTIAKTVQSIQIPVIANGDITDFEQARKVLDYTKSAGIMVGRGVQGQPWLIKELANRLQEKPYHQPDFHAKCLVIQRHLALLHNFYGSSKGVQIARKHIGWYLDKLGINCHHKKVFNQLMTVHAQQAFIDQITQILTKGNVA